MGEDSPEERLRLRLRELGLPVNGRRSDDISLRKLSQAMGINLQHENDSRKVKDDLVEALVSALLSEVPVLANFHASYVEASLKDLRQIRDSLSGQAEQSGELRERLSKLSIKDQRDHVVTLRDLSRSLELPLGSSMRKVDYVQQILTALLAEVPAIASVDDAKTALVDASLRELLALRDGLAGQASQRQELESRLDQFNVRGRSSDVVTLIDLCRSLGMATKQQGRYMSGGVLKRQIVEFLLRGSLDAAKKASVDTTLQELRRVRDGVEEHAARRGKEKRCGKNVGFQHPSPWCCGVAGSLPCFRTSDRVLDVRWWLFTPEQRLKRQQEQTSMAPKTFFMLPFRPISRKLNISPSRSAKICLRWQSQSLWLLSTKRHSDGARTWHASLCPSPWQ